MFSNVTSRLSSCVDAVICFPPNGERLVLGFCGGPFQDENLVNTQSEAGEGTQNRCSSYRPQKFIISKGTAVDKMSRKFETLQRKLHVSQKQYLGQNESDKCVTWLEITLWIYQRVTVQFLLIVQMEPRFCCHWCEQKKTRSSPEFCFVNVETRQILFCAQTF